MAAASPALEILGLAASVLVVLVGAAVLVALLGDWRRAQPALSPLTPGLEADAATIGERQARIQTRRRITQAFDELGQL